MVCGRSVSPTRRVTPCNLNMTNTEVHSSLSCMFRVLRFHGCGSNRLAHQNWSKLDAIPSPLVLNFAHTNKCDQFRHPSVAHVCSSDHHQCSFRQSSENNVSLLFLWATTPWLLVSTADFPLWLSRCDAFREFALMCPLSNGSRQNVMNMTFWAKLSGDERAMFLILALGCFGSLRPVVRLAEHGAGLGGGIYQKSDVAGWIFPTFRWEGEGQHEWRGDNGHVLPAGGFK